MFIKFSFAEHSPPAVGNLNINFQKFYLFRKIRLPTIQYWKPEVSSYIGFFLFFFLSTMWPIPISISSIQNATPCYFPSWNVNNNCKLVGNFSSRLISLCSRTLILFQKNRDDIFGFPGDGLYKRFVDRARNFRNPNKFTFPGRINSVDSSKTCRFDLQNRSALFWNPLIPEPWKF